MNKLKLQAYGIAMLFFGLLIFTISCQEELLLNSDETQIDLKSSLNVNHSSGEKISLLLEEMKILADSRQKIVVFELSNLEEDNYITHIRVLENSSKIIEFSRGLDKNFKSFGPDDNYTVTCTYSDGSTVVTECGQSTYCAGEATGACLDSGGCATVCNSKITYYPKIIN